MTPPQIRQLHLLSVDWTRTKLMTASTGLPVRTFELDPGDTTLQGTVRELAAAYGLRTPVLEIHFDYERAHDDHGRGPVPLLVVTESPPIGWVLPSGLAWRDLNDADPHVAAGLRPRLGELLAEWRGTAPVSPLRPPWAVPGWHARATAWTTERLVELARTPTGPAEQIRHWGVSAVMRVPTAARSAWFKAAFVVFRHEPAVTALLGAEAPDDTAPVLGRHDEEGWLLLDDIGSESIEEHPDLDAATIGTLVGLQRRFVGRAHDLVAAGAPVRPLTRLPDQLAGVLADPEMLAWLDLSPERSTQLVRSVAAAVAEIETLGYPDTLVHGDFHPSNVALRNGRPVIFDWSDATVTHPLVDAMTWSTWFDRDRERGNRAWQAFLQAWADVCHPPEAERSRPALERAMNAYHVVSYAGILGAMEPLRRPELADGLQRYVAALDAALPR